MSARASAWIAWSLAALSVAMFLTGAVLTFATLPTVPVTQPSSDWGTSGPLSSLLIFVPFLSFPLVGALIASRRHENPIGWICLATGLFWMFTFLEGSATDGSGPYPVTIDALFQWIWIPPVGLLGIYMILLFPDGKLPSKRWRPLAWFSGAVMVLASVAITISPGHLPEHPGVRNPFGLVGSEEHPIVVQALLGAIALLPVCILASAISLVWRYRRSGREEREQIKWIAFAGSFVGLMSLITVFSTLIFAPEFPDSTGTQPLWLGVLQDVELLSFAGIPVAVGIAVLRHRLYDIDIIINRALVYGSLTAILLAVYVGGVVGLQTIFRALSGQESTFAVVASTLAIAALFNPLRRRVQAFVDRRFYRRKYDAAKTLAAFNSRLREETDLGTLSDDVLGVVRETMQPEHASLWLRPDSVDAKEKAPG